MTNVERMRQISQEVRQPISVFTDSSGRESRLIPITAAYPEDFAGLPLADRVAYITEIQAAYSNAKESVIPFLRAHYPVLFEKANPASIHLAEIITDFRVRSDGLSFARRQLSGAEVTYRDELTEITGGKRGGKRIESRRKELARKWAEEIKPPLVLRVFAEQGLRYTVLDEFIRDFLLVPDGPENLLVAIQDLRTHTDFTDAQIEDLFQQASREMREARYDEEASYFSYKRGLDNLATYDQARVMRQLIELAFRENVPSGVQGNIADLARNTLEFYWRNLHSLYQVAGVAEETPLVAFFHDFMFAAGSLGDVDMILRAGDWILDKIGRSEAEFMRQYRMSVDRSRLEETAIIDMLRNDKRLQPGFSMTDFLVNNDPAYYQQIASQAKGRYVIGKWADRTTGLHSTFHFLGNHHRRNLYRDLMKERAAEAVKSIIRNPSSVQQILDDNESGSIIVLFRALLTQYTPAVLLDAIMTNLEGKQAWAARKSKMANLRPGEADLYKTSVGYRQILEGMTGDDWEKFTETAKVDFLIAALFIDLAPETHNEIVEIRRQVTQLVDQVRDENEWFVAPNGDQFAVARNPELAAYGLNSITFYPSFEEGSDGRVKVEFQTNISLNYGTPLSFSMYFDRYGRSYYQDGTETHKPYFLATALDQLVWSRLNHITSGALAAEGTITPGIGKEAGRERTAGARRSHFRHLDRSAGITLLSRQAQKHAEYVLAVYGIDIYQENLRRWSAEALDDKFILTFVKEVEKEGAPPNQLAYHPGV